MRPVVASVKNQARLRVFLKKVRKRHGLCQEAFGERIGLLGSTYAAFERKERNFGYDSMQKVAGTLPLNHDIVAAMLDPAAPRIALPAPESIRLPQQDMSAVAEVMIDLEMAAKIFHDVSAAGKPLPLSEFLRL